MSAFIVSNLHLNTIISTLVKEAAVIKIPGGRVYRAVEDATALFNVLAKANVDSVNARYNCHETGDFSPYRVDATSPEACIRLLQCLEYQSCEVGGWEATEAYHVILQSIALLACRIPAVNTQSWSI